MHKSKNEVKQATQSAKEAKSATENLAIPQNEEEKNLFSIDYELI